MAENQSDKEKNVSGAEGQDPKVTSGSSAKQEKPKATDAAQRKAEEKGVDIAAVEPTGKDDKVTKDDVERAAEAQAEASNKLIHVEFADIATATAIAPDGTLFVRPSALDPFRVNVVSEQYFDEVLADAVDSEGRSVFVKGGEA